MKKAALRHNGKGCYDWNASHTELKIYEIIPPSLIT